MQPFIFALCALGLASAQAALAQKVKVGEPPAQIGKLLACRDIENADQRLNCFDRETRVVADALARRDLVAVDREKMSSTRRSLFGFPLPKLGIFGSDDGDEVKQVDGLIAGVGRNRDGGYTFRLADGARWSQMDGKPIALEPRAGDKVVVKRGLLGSYILSVAGQPGVKVQRVN
jgi:hypothetical protein